MLRDYNELLEEALRNQKVPNDVFTGAVGERGAISASVEDNI